MTREPLPLATIHDAVLEFLRGRDDVVIFGAFAVNAYVDEPRMTQDVDVMATHALQVAEALRAHLGERFRIAIRIREVAGGRGYRIYQVQKPANRHLVDVRSAATLPPARRLQGVLVVEPVELIASKVIALHQRKGSPKAFTDMRDLAVLLLAFPDLKRDPGPVTDRLVSSDAGSGALATWTELVAAEIRPGIEDDEF